MEKKFIYKSVTALMLTIASVQSVLAGPGWVTQQNDDRVEIQYSVAPLTLNKKPIITKEEQWWSDFEASKSDNIVQYVHDLSESNPEAAAWFLLTGGKEGFAQREATSEEKKLLMGAMKKISSNLDKSQKIIEYCVSEIGKFHLDLMYKQFDQIAPIVKKLSVPTIEDKFFRDAKNDSFFRAFRKEQLEDYLKDANRLGEYSFFSDKLKKGILDIYIAIEDKYDSDRKPIESKYNSDKKAIEDKYDSDKKAIEDKYPGFSLDLHKGKEAAWYEIYKKKEAAWYEIYKKKEAATLDLYNKKKAVIKEMSKASYFDLVDLVNHYYPNTI